MSSTRRSFLFGVAALAAAPAAKAQTGNWPTRPLRIIIPTAPGGSPDMVSRTLGNKLTERFGQPVVVESITQGVGIVGNQMVSKSAPDGHTLAMLTGGFTTQAAVMKSLPYDPVRDFAFVTSVVAYPMFLLVAPNSPITSFQDLIDRARAAPGKVNYAIIGGGSVYHLLGKWIENRAGVEMTAVPYRGSVPAFTDVIGGRLDAMIDTATSAIPRIRNGQLRALAVSSPQRYPLMPDTPSMVETVSGIQADVVAGAGGAAANASPHHRSAQQRDQARARAADVDHGWRRPGCWPRRPRPRSCSSGSKPRSRSIPRSRRSTPSRPSNAKTPTIYQPASPENDMKLMYFNDYKLGVIKGEAVVDVSAVVHDIAHTGPHDLINGLIERFAEYRPRLEEATARGKGVPLADVKVRPPLPKPVNIDCMAVNYMEDGTRTEPAPINAFHKSPNAVIGPEDTMVLPDVPATIFEGEAEVAVVIGKRAKDVKAADAMSHVFGYVNFVDGSARGLPPPGNVFYQMKSRDTFAPMGPYIVTADEIRDPHQLQVRLWVNGVLKQNFNTSDMAHKIPRCIEWVSSIHTLEPGDVLATGTNHRGLSSFQDGDVVELESDGLGRLRFHVRDELKRTWGRETRLDMANKGSKEITTPQLTGKYAARS